ncbi:MULTISPECIES: hypothetical protein [unclassified Variovorax]|jgi:hypothetical protein|uniref:hypothetical protein n=1 Tax=unclassified Variovorax TaxID=663243 RepID=UPI0008D69636|nr:MULTISPECIES: hypothetical protein [unclassified Variovorax]SEK16469.1 hypothetical protein SAMN05518853_12631 [Variovorax sp. OK202]SFE48801.1 hypothetical protein SAMN05444746_12631 [Variovorax sp. OK212]
MPITLLLRLLHERFPVPLTTERDIRHASVLLATGLVDAEFHVDNLGYQRYESALVFSITEAGYAEITALRTCQAEADSASQQWPVMPLDYLRKIADAVFPVCTDDPAEINSVAVLNAAGMVKATLPSPCRASVTSQKLRRAVVLHITPLGRTAVVARRR